MTAICVIGDSHIGALMSGWREMGAEFPAFRTMFFGAPRAMLKDLLTPWQRHPCAAAAHPPNKGAGRLVSLMSLRRGAASDTPWKRA